MLKINPFLKLGVLSTLAVAISVPVAAEVMLKASAALTTPREQTQAYIKHFLNVINAEGKGQVQTKYIGGPEVTPPRKQAAALKRGSFDITMSPASYYIGMVPEGYAILVTNMGRRGFAPAAASPCSMKRTKRRLTPSCSPGASPAARSIPTSPRSPP